MRLVRYDQVKSKIIEVRQQKVILDSDVAEIYGVETKQINQAIKRNIAKFPRGYLIDLTSEEWGQLKSQFVTSKKGGKIKLPTAFTECSHIICA
ncbi:MAG: ORF6N domain-containing protein [Gammaproteobacteria bacterium]|nr:ORF6N domain-containing protein [Gammaproteobacteria bacterium]